MDSSPHIVPAYGAYAPKGLLARLIAATRAMQAGGLPRKFGFVIRRLATVLLRRRPVDIEAFGARFRLYPYFNLCEKRILFTPQDFDPTERAILAQTLRPGFIFLDVGANIGGYALAIAALAGRDAQIIAIEPQPVLFDRLVYNIGINPFATVKALAVAVVDRDGEVTLFLDGQNKGEASLRIVNQDDEGRIRVPARALLGLVREEGLPRIDAIKLDVEGAEDLILQRFLQQAPERLWPRLLILERGEARWSTNLLHLLAEKGYVYELGTRNNHILSRTPSKPDDAP
jgi:FkbM family methyltransferase